MAKRWMCVLLLLAIIGGCIWGCAQRPSPVSNVAPSGTARPPAGAVTAPRAMPNRSVSAGSRQEPSPQHRVTLIWDRKVELIGYDVVPNEAGRTTLTMYYKCLAPITQDYSVWTHLTPAYPAALTSPTDKQYGFVVWGFRIAPSTRTWQPGMYYATTESYPLPRGGGAWSVETNLVAPDAAGGIRPLLVANPEELKGHFGCYVLPAPIKMS